MTCVDAILGTDIKRIAKQLEDECGRKVIASFMDPIARESRKAPMVCVQQSIYSALEKTHSDNRSVNIIGAFVPLKKDSEIITYLHESGIKNIYQISECKTYDEYQLMASSCLNIVINPQALAAAEDMKEKLNIPYVVFDNVYGLERITEQYKKLSGSIKIHIDDTDKYNAESKLKNFS